MKAFMACWLPPASPVAEETILIGDTDFGALATKIAAGCRRDLARRQRRAGRQPGDPVQTASACPNVTLFGTAGLGGNYLKIGGKAVENTYAIDFNDQSTAPMKRQSSRENYKKCYNTEFPDNLGGGGGPEALLAPVRSGFDAEPDPRDSARGRPRKLKDAEWCWQRQVVAEGGPHPEYARPSWSSRTASRRRRTDDRGVPASRALARP